MRTYVLYMYGLFIIGAQGILLIFGLNSLGRSKNNTLLSLLLILVSCSLFGRASTFDPRIFNFQPKLILLPEIILFTYAPILYIYFARLAQVKVRPYLKILIFLPALAQLIIYIPYLFKANQTFVYLMIDRELFEAFAASGAFSLLFCSFFWWRIGRWKPKIKGLVKQNELTTAHLSFFKSIHFTSFILLAIWVISLVTYAWGLEFQIDQTITTAEVTIDILWLLFSSTIFYISYFIIKYPEIFRDKKKYENTQLDEGEHDRIRGKLNELLTHKKVFKDPDLTLASLSYEIPTSPHTLSRIINESFHCTFSSLINKHRIEEFILLATKREEDSYLSLAYEVGFQSKATFNRAFKREKEVSPRAYFEAEA